MLTIEKPQVATKRIKRVPLAVPPTSEPFARLDAVIRQLFQHARDKPIVSTMDIDVRWEMDQAELLNDIYVIAAECKAAFTVACRIAGLS